MRLALFDIDGTLITTGHAGMRAYYRAMHSVFGISMDGDLIHPDGKTDPLIAKELLACYNLSDKWCERSRKALFDSYLDFLREEMCESHERGSVRVLPGVVQILESLSLDSRFALGLVTGNLEKGAQIKLEAAGLFHYFKFGGYGSDSENRTDLTRIGIRRGEQLVAPKTVEAAFVIGDTPLDVLHGRAAGAYVIAVASARYGIAELEPHKPDLLVRDLMQVPEIMSFMRNMP